MDSRYSGDFDVTHGGNSASYKALFEYKIESFTMPSGAREKALVGTLSLQSATGEELCLLSFDSEGIHFSTQKNGHKYNYDITSREGDHIVLSTIPHEFNNKIFGELVALMIQYKNSGPEFKELIMRTYAEMLNKNGYALTIPSNATERGGWDNHP